MAGEIDVGKEVSEVSVIETGEKCGLDTSSCKDLTNVGRGANGAGIDRVVEDPADSVANSDGSHKDDLNSSYVIVTGAEGVGDDPDLGGMKAENANSCTEVEILKVQREIEQSSEIEKERVVQGGQSTTLNDEVVVEGSMEDAIEDGDKRGTGLQEEADQVVALGEVDLQNGANGNTVVEDGRVEVIDGTLQVKPECNDERIQISQLNAENGEIRESLLQEKENLVESCKETTPKSEVSRERLVKEASEDWESFGSNAREQKDVVIPADEVEHQNGAIVDTVAEPLQFEKQVGLCSSPNNAFCDSVSRDLDYEMSDVANEPENERVQIRHLTGENGKILEPSSKEESPFDGSDEARLNDIIPREEGHVTNEVYSFAALSTMEDHASLDKLVEHQNGILRTAVMTAESEQIENQVELESSPEPRVNQDSESNALDSVVEVEESGESETKPFSDDQSGLVSEKLEQNDVVLTDKLETAQEDESKDESNTFQNTLVDASGGEPPEGNTEDGEMKSESYSEPSKDPVETGESHSPSTVLLEPESCQLGHEGKKVKVEAEEILSSGSCGVANCEDQVDPDKSCQLEYLMNDIDSPSESVNVDDSITGREESLELKRSFEDPENDFGTGSGTNDKPVKMGENFASGSADDRELSETGNEASPPAKDLTDHTSAVINENSEYKNTEGFTSTFDNADTENVKFIRINENCSIEGRSISSSVSHTGSGTEFGVSSGNYEEGISLFAGVDQPKETGVSDVNNGCVHDIPGTMDVQLQSDVESSSVLSRDTPFHGSVTPGSEVTRSTIRSSKISDTVVFGSFDFGNVLDQANVADGISHCKTENGHAHKDQIDETSSTSPSESSSADITTGKGVAVEIIARSFSFLIRLPRFDDAKLKELIRHADLEVVERTRDRDAIQLEIKKRKGIRQQHGIEFGAAKSQEENARRKVKAKREEIEYLQSKINRVKNAISVDDIDVRIYNMEHMIQHETLDLKDEKQLIREMKQLRQLREQLCSNMGSHDEVQQAMEEKDQTEEHMKILRKELDGFKNTVLKAKADALAASRKYEDETEKLKQLQDQFEAANSIRQAAYVNRQSLRRDLYEKNKHFRTYKDDAAQARRYAFIKDREALHGFCVNQVERNMELWNKDDEFRKEYVRCNARSTLRRFGTLDGRSLGPDEEPPVAPGHEHGSDNELVSDPAKVNFVPETLRPDEGIQVTPVRDEIANDKPISRNVKKMDENGKGQEPAKSVARNDPAKVSVRDMTDDAVVGHTQAKEQLELARKEEELRKLEAAATLKEQRRLEEMAKQKEAEERKRRKDEKAQIRAELRARKESEQKEKEREKRLRKKERKKATATDGPHDNTDDKSASISDNVAETVKELQSKDAQSGVAKKPQKSVQYMKQNKVKSVPPPLRNKNKRKWQQWLGVLLTSLLVVAIFLLGNIGFFSNLKRQSSGF